MKRINKLFNPRLPVAILLSTVVLASCTKKFDEINTDRNAIATVGASELPKQNKLQYQISGTTRLLKTCSQTSMHSILPVQRLTSHPID